MEKNPLEHLVEGQYSPDATQPISEESLERVRRGPKAREPGFPDVAGAKRPENAKDGSPAGLENFNEALKEKLGGRVLISKKDGRAVEFVEAVWEGDRAVIKLRVLGGSQTETVDETQVRWDPKTGGLVSEDWMLVEVVSEEKKQAA